MIRRFRLTILLGLALTVIPASALAASHHAVFKTGTYKGKNTAGAKFSITLQHMKCKVPSGLGAPALGLCVGLPVAPEMECLGSVPTPAMFPAFVTPVRLSASGNAIEHANISEETVPGEAPSAGTQTFSVSFTKKGTVSGYLEESVNFVIQGSPLPCTTGKVPFTAKLS
jgi:hypothetical protein